MLGRKLLVRLLFLSKNLFPKSSKSFVYSERMNTKHSSELVLTKGKVTWKEPFEQFKIWYDEACATPGIIEPRAMCLATCTRSGIPSARFVILRDYDTNGFQFFTNYCSRKGEELNENPNAALVFYWECLKKSIRIEGNVEKLSEKKSSQFFHSRPKDYQIEAAFSDQSQPISNRSSLSEKEKAFRDQYKSCEHIPRPKNWGGFIVKPQAIEFSESQSNSLNNRIRFRIPKENEIIDNILLHQGENGWVYERLQP